MLKQWLDAGKCLVGAHQGEWVAQGDPTCELVRTCTVCGAQARRVEHTWGAWAALADDPCQESRACSRCGGAEQREEHEPGPWQYEENGRCEQTHRCERCGRPYAETRTKHAWGSWTYSERHRSPVRTCTRCFTCVAYFGAEVDPGDHVAISEAGGGASKDTAGRVAFEISEDDVADLLARAEQQQSRPTDRDALPPGSEYDGPSERAARTSERVAQLAAIRAFYDAEVASGRIASERRPRYEALLSELEEILENPSDQLADLQVSARRVQELMSGLSAALMDPSRGQPVAAPVEGSRTAALQRWVRTMFEYVTAEMAGSSLIDAEGQALGQFLGSLRGCREALAEPAEEASLTKLETDSLRPLAQSLRQFSLRDHLTIADPVWPSPMCVPDPNAVFYAGGDRVGDVVRRACQARALRVLLPVKHKEPASARWNQLREAAVAVFDLTAYERSTSLDAAACAASVCYEVGIALALGRPLVIVSDERRALPFDLDIEPVHFSDDLVQAESVVGPAIDEALYGLQRGRAGSSVAATVTELRARYGAHGDSRVRTSIAQIDDQAARDPVKTRLLAASSIGFLGVQAPQMIFPAWPGAYPRDATPTCFHVTPFGPPWARQMRDIVRGACPAGMTYVRGDQVLDSDIVRSIWDEICTAERVVVDLTGLNANVVLELGIAHVLGRIALLVSQDAAPERYFRAVAKHRVHHYALDNKENVEALSSLLREFLGPAR